MARALQTLVDLELVLELELEVEVEVGETSCAPLVF